MARTARNRVQETPVEQKTFQVGIYARLSVEGDDRKNESIDTQIEIAKHYMAFHPEMTLYDIYTDLGATGTNFEREGFERMMQDIRRRNINCVIVKDLSRFGRNCVETGNYIQKIFPFMNVRFIAVSDSIDTFDPDLIPDELTVNIKNLVNELYAKDIAKKVKSSRQAHWERGSFTGGLGPYGYQCEWNGKIKALVVDEEPAKIVKDIFSLFLEGNNLKQIVRVLFERRVHTPSVMHSCGHVFQQEGERLQQWTTCSVKMILTNPVYVGCLVQATAGGKQYRLRKPQDVESGDYNVHMSTHEAIISEEDFYKVAQKLEIMSARYNHKDAYKPLSLDEDIYQNIVFCGDCGKRMERVANIKKLSSGSRIRWYGYRCNNSDKLDIMCPAKGISKVKLDELVLAALEQEFKLSSIRPKAVVDQCKKTITSQINRLEMEREKAEGEIPILNRRLSEAYMQYRIGNMTINEFQKKKNELDSKSAVYNKDLTTYNLKIRTLKTELEEKSKFLNDLMKCKKKDTVLTREVISTLIKRIEIYPDYRVEIQFAFRINELLEEMMNQ